MADSSYFEQGSNWLARKLAELITEGRNDLPGALARYAKGAAQSGQEQLELMGRVSPTLKPLALMGRMLPQREERSVMNLPPDTQPSMRADSTAEDLGNLVGLPQPSAGADPAMRKLVTKVFDRNKITAAEDLRRAGASDKEIWSRVGVGYHKGDWYQDIGGDPPKLKRLWASPNENQAYLGDFIEWPAAMDTLKRFGLTDPERIIVRRKKGSGAYINFGTTTSGEPRIQDIFLGDGEGSAETLRSLAHELQHAVDWTQTGVPAGANSRESAEAYLRIQGNPHGWRTLDDLVSANFTGDSALREEAQKLYDGSWAYYANNPGEQRAMISSDYSQLSPQERVIASPFAQVSNPSGGRRFLHTKEKGVLDSALEGYDMVAGPGMPEDPKLAKGAQIDRATNKTAVERLLAEKPAGRDRLEAILSELLNAP